MKKHYRLHNFGKVGKGTINPAGKFYGIVQIQTESVAITDVS